MTEAFDLASLDFQKDQDEGIPVDITHPKTGERIGLKIWVAGPDSDRQRKARRATLNARLQLRNQKVTAELLEGEGVAFLAKATIRGEFDPGVTFSGKADWSEKLAEEIFTRLPFAFEQVNSAAGERAGFIKG